MKSEELKPCPFCGAKDIKSLNNFHQLRDGGLRMQWKVSCNYCCVDMFSGESEEVARKRWNTRSNPTVAKEV